MKYVKKTENHKDKMHCRNAKCKINVLTGIHALMQSYIFDVREDRMHKPLCDPVKISQISIFHHL